MILECKHCGHSGDGFLYSPFHRVRVKYQYPFIVEVTFPSGKQKQVGFNTEAEMRLYYLTDTGEESGITWKRFFGKSKSSGTWEWSEKDVCKKCKKDQL